MISLFHNLGGQFLWLGSDYISRWKRFLALTFYLLPACRKFYPIKNIQLPDWIVHWMFCLGDILALPEAYSIFSLLVKPNTRALKGEEIQAINQIFLDNIKLRTVLIDDTARLVTRKKHIAYVSYQTINYWQDLSLAVFIHECMHVLQFQRLGSAYIYEALKAQNSTEGYDYGGPEQLKQAMLVGKRVEDFNFEQQAEIVEDAYKHLKYSKHIPIQYQYFMQHLDTYGRI